MAAETPASVRARVTGCILAGGGGRRFGGRDKGLLEFDGQPLVARVHARLAPQVAHVLVSANRNADVYRRYGTVVADPPAFALAGPLAGLLAALRIATTPWLCTVPCDGPYLPHDLVARLAAVLVPGGPRVAVVRSAGHLQPVFALYARTLAIDLEHSLATGAQAVAAWLCAQHAIAVDFDHDDAFVNINTPADLQRAVQDHDTHA